MTTTNVTPNIDIKKLTDDVNGLSVDQLREQLTKVRVRQKKQQSKMQGSASQKAYQLKQREQRKLMIARAKELGIYDAINEQAAKLAEAELAAESPEADTEEEVEETTA